MARGELRRGNTFARPCDFYTILPLREVLSSDGESVIQR